MGARRSARARRARREGTAVLAGIAAGSAAVVAAAAAAVLTAGTAAALPVEVVAATAAAPAAAPWTRSAPSAPAAEPLGHAAAPAPPVDGTAAGQVSAGGGMPVPQPPRPVRTGPAVPPFTGHGEPPVLTPRPPTCGGHASPRRVSPGVVPGPGGTATVSWQAGGRAEVVGYRVAAVGQTLRPGGQPAPLARTAAQPADCTPVSVTVAGLTPGEAYVFWLEERTVDLASGAERYVQVGTSPAVIAR